MTASYQPNALDISYNGWENYETWNVVLTEKNGMYHAKYENSTSVIAYSKSLAYVNKKIQKLAEIYNVNVV
jgi:hypothetical protein